jgi:FKBP-type peptidyl-prolyl cis-trans isomerase FkpA
MNRITLSLAALLLATAAQAAPPADPAIAEARQQATAAGVEITDLKVGKGPAIHAGQIATVHYTGWLYDPAAPDGKGKEFDSSVKRGEAFSFPLGQHHVIPGWEFGVAGMQKGGSRRLKIPPEQGYGARGAGGVIPPNATLVFDVKLLSFTDSPAAQ